jgi:hypothetical protein
MVGLFSRFGTNRIATWHQAITNNHFRGRRESLAVGAFRVCFSKCGILSPSHELEAGWQAEGAFGVHEENNQKK